MTAWLNVVRAADADILVLGDIDFDLNGVALQVLAESLRDYPHRFTRRPNRGLDSERDLNGNGRLGEPEDAEGYGTFAGQGGMAVLSRLPLVVEGLRDHSRFLWRDMPGAQLLGDGGDPTYLSTTVHWDLPVGLADGTTLHLLIWHATAPVFDGPEDRNGRRNHDEVRFWRDYIDGAVPGGPTERFIVIGTANADPMDGERRPGAITGLLAHPKLRDLVPESRGAQAASQRDGGVNTRHRAPAAHDTVDWPDDRGSPGNLRVDYVLPSADLPVVGSGVLWPLEGAPLSEDAARASRHRLVWLDIAIDPAPQAR